MSHSEPPLLVQVVVEEHASQQARGVAGRQGGGRQPGGHRGGRTPAPAGARGTFLLEQVLPEDPHQVLIEPRASPREMSLVRDSQSVLSPSWSCHALSFSGVIVACLIQEIIQMDAF